MTLIVWCPGSCGHILNVWDLLDLFRSEFLIFDLPPEKEFCITLFRKLHQIEAKQAKKIYGGISHLFFFAKQCFVVLFEFEEVFFVKKNAFSWEISRGGKIEMLLTWLSIKILLTQKPKVVEKKFDTKNIGLWKFCDFVVFSAKQGFWSNSCILEAKSRRNCEQE